MRELAVVREAAHAEVDAAAGHGVGVPLREQRARRARSCAGCARSRAAPRVGGRQPRRRTSSVNAAISRSASAATRDLLLGRAPDHLVVDVGEVADEGHAEPARAEVADERVGDDQEARVADVRARVDRDAAPVEPDVARRRGARAASLRPVSVLVRTSGHGLLVLLAQPREHRESSSVVVSPVVSLPAAMSRSRRRMILPLRVFGSESVKRMSSGRAKAPISLATCAPQLLLERVARLHARLRASRRRRCAWPLSSSGRPTTAASATAGWLTSALSTSIVPSRWPATLSTSSTRPMIQK